MARFLKSQNATESNPMQVLFDLFPALTVVGVFASWTF
jgi:hypothetical protein